MAYEGLLQDWLRGYIKGNRKYEGKFAPDTLNKTLLPQGFRGMGQNTQLTDARNAMVGATSPQPLNFWNDWANREGGLTEAQKGMFDVGEWAGRSLMRGTKDILGGDFDPMRALGVSDASKAIKAMGAGLPVQDVDIGRSFTGAASALPVVGSLIGGRSGGQMGRAAKTAVSLADVVSKSGMDPMADINLILNVLGLLA